MVLCLQSNILVLSFYKLTIDILIQVETAKKLIYNNQRK